MKTNVLAIALAGVLFGLTSVGQVSADNELNAESANYVKTYGYSGYRGYSRYLPRFYRYAKPYRYYNRGYRHHRHNRYGYKNRYRNRYYRYR